ncbi:hypothetical protein SCHPADRAFT_885805 [Schizopora paradoxa]|uniref:Uncharacterized protein n=1 Tax=Schizopora paradoxa TaxID=27342 RepID=A0A0H2SB27_9AGAM|nr:hypothetical protein SCHPADRAFT_885805 [Schizopora paradoxa]
MTTIMTSSLWSVLRILLDFSQIIVPTIIVYLTDAPVSLKVWLGAQNAQSLPKDLRAHVPESRGFLEKLRRLSPPWFANLECALLALFLLVVSVVDMFMNESPAKKFIIFGILVLPGTYSVWRLPLSPMILIIKSKIVPIFVQLKEKSSVVYNLVLSLSGIGVCVVALLDGANSVVQKLCQAVLYGAFLHIFTLASIPTAAKRTLRRHVFLGAAVGVVFVVSFVIIMVLFSGKTESHSGDLKPSKRNTPVWLHRMLSFTWSWIAFEFISLCYKMDYAFALDLGQVPTPRFRRSRVDAAKPIQAPEQQPRIVRIHPSFQPSFDKPFYKASIAGLAFFAISMTYLTGVFERSYPPARPEEYNQFPYFVSVLASPVIILFVLTLAYWKGEFRRVWNYEERWNDVPESVPFIDDEIESDDFTQDLELRGKEVYAGEEE